MAKTGEPYEVRLVDYIPTLIIEKRHKFSKQEGKTMFEKHPYTNAIWRFKDIIKGMDLRHPLEQAKEFGLGSNLKQFIVFNRVGSTEPGRSEGTAESK